MGFNGVDSIRTGKGVMFYGIKRRHENGVEHV
jgi:hypothetical protein